MGVATTTPFSELGGHGQYITNNANNAVSHEGVSQAKALQEEIKRVIIIGGGIAGLSTAIALKRNFPLAEVIIIEPAHGNCSKGPGMLLMNNGVKSLQDLGAGALLNNFQPITRGLIKQADGRVISDETFSSEEQIFCCSHQHILEGLESMLDQSCVVRVNKKCQTVELNSNDYVTKIFFSDETTLEVSPRDLVVASDGYRSILCATLNPNMKRPASPVNEIVSSTFAPKLARRIGNTFHKTVCCSAGLGYGLLASTPSQVIGFIQFDTSKHDVPRTDQEKKSLFDLAVSVIEDPSQREPFEEYVKIANMDIAHIWKPINSDLPAKLHAKNAVLIGDAAHPLIPFTSQGTSMALEDAIILAQTLKNHDHPSLDAALGHFVEKRRPIANEFIDGGREILAGFLQANPSAPYCTRKKPISADDLAFPPRRLSLLNAYTLPANFMESVVG